MKKYLSWSFSIAVLLSLAACTDLTEENFSNIDASVYYQNETSVKGAVSAIYGEAAYGFCEYFFYLNEFSADQIAWRTWNAGGWGWDEGLKFVLSTQTWTSEAKIVLQAWQKAWKTIGLCNQLIYDLQKLDPATIGMTQKQIDAYIAEVRTLRAWAYYNNFELWGGALPLNVDVTTDVPGSADADFDKGCKTIFDFIVKELDESCLNLSQEDGSNATRNRMNQAMNRMLKMRLMLNAEVFIKTNMYAQCEALCDSLLNGSFGSYSIVSDYRDIFELNNETCPEVVFAFANENGQLNIGWMRDVPFLPYNYDSICGGMTSQSGWNCVILAPSYDNSGTQLETGGTTGARCFLDAPYNDKLGAVYARLEEGDIRKQPYAYTTEWNGGCILRGEQKSVFDGHTICADADRNGQPLVYVDQVGQFATQPAGYTTTVADGQQVTADANIVQNPRWGQTNSGLRLMKYPIYPASEGVDYQSIDEVEFRWAEVVFTKAECAWRTKGTSPKDLVNSVRQRYFVDSPMTDEVASTWSDAEWMLHQWGLEFLCEGRRRRTDLRRFNQFTQGQWWFFDRAVAEGGGKYPAQRDKKYEWFPLPENAISVNPGLKQNPNY